MTKKEMPKVPGYDQQIPTDSTDNMKSKKVLVIPSAKIQFNNHKLQQKKQVDSMSD